MSLLSKLFGLGDGPSYIEAIGNVIDKNSTTDEERMQGQATLELLRQQPAALQVELNKVEAQHRTVFVAGWRPAIGWVCAASLFFAFFVNPMIQWLTGAPGPDILADKVLELTLAMLGLSGLRTYEKLKGRTK